MGPKNKKKSGSADDDELDFLDEIAAAEASKKAADPELENDTEAPGDTNGNDDVAEAGASSVSASVNHTAM